MADDKSHKSDGGRGKGDWVGNDLKGKISQDVRAKRSICPREAVR